MTKFRFKPEALASLDMETRRGTSFTRSGHRDRMDCAGPEATPGAWVIELAAQRCGKAALFDYALLSQIRKMSIQDVLIAAHGYLDGELTTTNEL